MRGQIPNGVELFTHPEFGQVRTTVEGDTPLFCGKDVAAALGYKRERDALQRHVRGAVFRRPIQDALGRTQEAKFITEPDVYRLIIGSKLPSAQRFEAWVMEEVLPTIRRHGMYATPSTVERLLDDPDSFIQVLQALKEERAQREAAQAQVAEMAPKALFADAVATSHTTILVGDLAKLLKGNGIEIGATRLFAWLRTNGFLISRKGTDWNMPTQRSMELGLFKIKETAVTHSDGHVSVSKTPKVTGKGQQYFVERFLDGRFAVDQRGAA